MAKVIRIIDIKNKYITFLPHLLGNTFEQCNISNIIYSATVTQCNRSDFKGKRSEYTDKFSEEIQLLPVNVDKNL